MASRDQDHEPRTPPPLRDAARIRWTADGVEPGQRRAPEETAVALVHDASTTAVMMATPADLEDFAVGFSLSEGAIVRVEDIRELDVVSQDLGVEVRMWLAPDRALHVASRRRRLAGPTGCGLCGVDSLAEAVRSPRPVAGEALRVDPAALLAAMAALSNAQPLGRETRAMHAAGFWTPTSGLLAVREDVGRHNALDKLIGARARSGAVDGSDGVVLLTSRVSVEMVQKTAVLGAPILCAVSAPTALAIRVAEEAGITLVAVARADGFEVFSHSERILA
ncbi:formate dehydrogenase accessory sulfurtransferase FdhD [Brevundimonas vesicularis]|uniref:formate dehydrogenase accessory sulfurtransferase FdhD n=1 Tax=Brevundimonas vesicularis TaxID=41276 RepID=UPI0030C45AAC